MRLLLVSTLLLSLAAAIAAALGYVMVDQRVASLLASPMERGISAILSDIARLDPSTPPEHVEAQLLRRRYRNVSSSPSVAGEYHRRGDKFEVYTREFTAPDGITIPSRLVTWSGNPTTNTTLLLEGQIISVLGGSTRSSEHRPLSVFPKHLIDAVLAIEDERFYSHFGIDLEGIARAALANLKALRIVQGGSTITQQLAKNLLFSRVRSLKRKAMEAPAAISLEQRLSKEQILELYFNEVYLGQEGAVALHGFESASRSFFGKRAQDISHAESALLAGIIQAPSLYSPRRHPVRARSRRDVVLRKMRSLAVISPEELRRGLNTPVKVIEERLFQRRAPHYVTFVTNQMVDLFGDELLQIPDLKIFTGIDLDLQQCAERAVAKGLASLEKQHPKLARTKPRLEVGLVSVEPFSGKVKAWVGGRDYSKNQFDHVAQGRRQIGSTIKPFLYLTALDGSINSYRAATPLSILTDEPIKMELISKRTWVPENYDHTFQGDVTLRYALERSLNIPAIQVLKRIGIGAFVNTLERLELGKNIPEVPALALGALDTSLLELTGAFGTLANGGIYVRPRGFVSVLDDEDSRLATSEILERRIALEAPVFVLSNILQGAVERGTGAAIRRSGYTLPVAGKTGTSNEARDLWFVGYTPDLVSGVWLGFDDNRKVGLTGGAAAAPIWAEYMKCASGFRSPSEFIAPPGVVRVTVDRISGLTVDPACPSKGDTTDEYFVSGTQPPYACEKVPPVETEEVEGPTGSRPVRKRSFFERLFDL